MKTNIILFVACFVVAFATGYLFFDGGNDTASTNEQVQDNAVTSETSEPSSEGDESANDDTSEEGETTVPADAEPLNRNNCLSCHAVDSLGAEGGTTGPDLSNAFNEVEGKHGRPLEEFLQEPTSAVMSDVIGDNPLEDEEREAIIEALKQAVE